MKYDDKTTILIKILQLWTYSAKYCNFITFGTILFVISFEMYRKRFSYNSFTINYHFLIGGERYSSHGRDDGSYRYRGEVSYQFVI